MRALALLAVLPVLALAQNFDIPSSWREPSTTSSRDQRAALAQSAQDLFKPLYNSSTGYIADLYYDHSPLVYSALARKDWMMGTQTNKWVMDAIKQAYNQNPGFRANGYVHNPIVWGIAALDAYKAYKDSSMLTMAHDNWNDTLQWQVSPTQAQAGSIPGKNYKFVSTCAGKTMAGMVFWNSYPTGSMNIYSITTGHFVVFASLLADVAKSEGRDYSDYVSSATLTGDFILNHMLDSNNLVLNVIGTNDTVACNFNRAYWSRNTGNMIEAFAVLADVTGDSKWLNAYESSIAGATVQATWNGNDGVVTEGTDSTDVDARALKGRYIASFYQPWSRTKNTKLKSYISAYVDVQLNAMIDLATVNGSNFYSSNWHGPAVSSYTADGQIAAVDVLGTTAAIDSSGSAAPGVSSSASASGSSTSSSVGPKPTDDGGDKKSSSGKTIGIAVGVAVPVALAIIAGLIFFLRRRSKRHQDEPATVTPMAQNYTGGPGFNNAGDTYNSVGAIKAQTPNMETTPFVSPLPAATYGQQYTAPTQDYNQGYGGFDQQQQPGQQAAYDPRQSGYGQQPYQPTQYGGDPRPQSSHLSPATTTTALPSAAGYAASAVGSDGDQHMSRNEKGTLLTWRNEQSSALEGASSGSGVQQRPGEDLPTQDLIRILNQRVAGGAEPQGDMPPSYQERPR